MSILASPLSICRFTAEEKEKRPKLAHMPFGLGLHNCLGMKFALLETKLALIGIRSTFVQSPETEVWLQDRVKSDCSVYIALCELRIVCSMILNAYTILQVPLQISHGGVDSPKNGVLLQITSR